MVRSTSREHQPVAVDSANLSLRNRYGGSPLSLELGPLTGECAAPVACRSLMVRRAALGAVGAVLVCGGLAYLLSSRREQFATALHSAPLEFLAAAVLLQVIALLSRSEAWRVCIVAAGGTVSRRLVFRAAGVGSLASVLNGSAGMAARIMSLRRAAPDSTPPPTALVAAEVPIIVVEIALAAIFSFTLVPTLGVPWWVPPLLVLAMAGAVLALHRVSKARTIGLWSGLAVLRGPGGARMVCFTLLAVCTQILRNWLMLHALGVEVSPFGAMALLIAMFTLGQLPIGPSIGPAAAVLILGSHGVAVTAAAGVLLAVTGTTGSLGYAGWSIADRVFAGRLPQVGAPVPPAAVVPSS